MQNQPNGWPSSDSFIEAFLQNLGACDWEPHPLYSVFTQPDRDWYLAQREAFVHKYRCFYALSKTIAPRQMIELGVCVGAGADAYLSATPQAQYTGIDTFGEPFDPNETSPWERLRTNEDSLWKPYDLTQRLLEERGFQNYRLMVANLRHLRELPHEADLVIVDAAHDFENEYADLQLALTANPSFIFVDDAADENQAKPAIQYFLGNDLRDGVEFTSAIDYIGGGLVIKLARDFQTVGSSGS